MIRNDFVSNSSSSSFLLTLDKSCSLNDFCKKVSRNTELKDKKYHIPNLKEKNETILKYSFNNIKLLFLGSILINKIHHRIIKDLFKDGWEEDVFNHVMANHRNGKFHEFNTDYTVVDENTIEYECSIYCSKITVRNADSTFRCYLKDIVDPENIRGKKYVEKVNREATKQIISLLKKIDKMPYNLKSDFMWSTYLIDEETIRTTEKLIEHGVEIEFNKEFGDLTLEKAKSIIEDGHKIIYMDVGNSGDGIESRRIYTEKPDWVSVFENVPVSILDSEYQ